MIFWDLIRIFVDHFPYKKLKHEISRKIDRWKIMIFFNKKKYNFWMYRNLNCLIFLIFVRLVFSFYTNFCREKFEWSKNFSMFWELCRNKHFIVILRFLEQLYKNLKKKCHQGALLKGEKKSFMALSSFFFNIFCDEILLKYLKV